MKLPKPITDLYADLRDRRLLPLVIVLVLATLALPVLLSSETDVPPPPDSTAAVASEAGEIPTLPAVLAADPDLRDYRERLNALREKDPFAQHFQAPKVKGSTVENVGEVPAPEAVASGGLTASGGSASTETGASTSSSAGGSTSEAVTETVTETVTEVQEVLVTHELDVEIDGPGKTRKFKNVEEMETVPGKKTPLVVYVGVVDSGKDAIFMLSRDVVTSDGDGKCSPSRSDCQLLTLGEGEQRKLDYAPDGGESERYVLKLHRIDRVTEKLD